MDTEYAGLHIGPFRVLKVLSRNSFAQTWVYRVIDIRTGQEAVVKTFDLNASGESSADARRFRREIEIISALTHPHILVPFYHGEEKGRVYYAMPYMEGGTLAHRLAHGPLTLEEVTRILQDVTAALIYAHERDILHRDLKPSNILFDGEGRALLADFGLAKDLKRATHQVTRTGAVVGTPRYMAPEQWVGEKLDFRTDLYSLGAILFEMLTGAAPFDSEDSHTLMAYHLYSPPPRVSDKQPDLPFALTMMVDRALAKSPAKRFASAQSMLKQFEAAAHNQNRVRLVPKPRHPGGQSSDYQRAVPPSEQDFTTKKLDRRTLYANQRRARLTQVPTRRRVRWVVTGLALLGLIMVLSVLVWLV